MKFLDIATENAFKGTTIDGDFEITKDYFAKVELPRISTITDSMENAEF